VPFLPVGGQAVIEGVMMRSPSKVAVAVRRPDGSLAFFERPFVSVTRRVRAFGLPVIRGAISLFETLYLGVTALNFSADESVKDAPPVAGGGGAERMASPAGSVVAGPATAAVGPAGAVPSPKGKSSGLGTAAQGLTLVVSFGLGLLLFVVLPAKLTGWLGFQDRVGFGLVDGLFRLIAFLLYLLIISQWKEMARVLGYHGAEHKAIHALENGAPLTPESVQTFTRFHPRCGTSFLFLIVVVSIVAFTAIGKPRGVGDHLLRIACMPLIAGVAFEFIRFSGKYADRPFVRALIWPGLQFQRLTTREPDLSMCEVAIAALDRVRGDETVVALERAGAEARAEIAFVQ
jgi:uncharacterized protein YqhQ